MKENIRLINHASLFMKFNKDMSFLTDPWYTGSAFDNGWSLLHENNEKFIENVLNNTDYIYISHEHPDHFSISFFKEYSQLIRDKKIKIIFQKTLDKRVEKFLNTKLNLELIILESYKTVNLQQQKLTLVTCGSIDSSLIIETEDCYHINLNDCDFVDSELKKIKKLITNKKKIIVYLQFSYAAYRSDDQWLKKAAEYKLSNLLKIYKYFEADLLIPFASFIYFSSSENFHLNKHMNNAEITSNFLMSNNVNHCILNPDEEEINIEKLIYDKTIRSKINKSSIDFWDKKFRSIKPFNENIEKYEISDEIKKNFLLRVRKKNSIFLLFLIRFVSLKFFFGDTVIYINDTKETYIVNFFKILKNNNISQSKIDIEMKSKRFFFLLKEAYGLDTLSVNGCFSDFRINGFEKLIKSIGFVTLNQSDEGIKIKNIFSKNIINRIISIFTRLISRNS